MCAIIVALCSTSSGPCGGFISIKAYAKCTTAVRQTELDKHQGAKSTVFRYRAVEAVDVNLERVPREVEEHARHANVEEYPVGQSANNTRSPLSLHICMVLLRMSGRPSTW